MPIEIMLVPMVGLGTREDPFTPKYMLDERNVEAGGIRYGNEEVAIALYDADQVVLNEYAADAEVTRLATQANVNSTVNVSQRNAFRAILEAEDIPSFFVNTGDTRRQVIRAIIGLFLFSQRVEGIFGENWRKKARAAGINLNSVWVDFPPALQSVLIGVRDSFGWTNVDLGVTNASTLREILKSISDQFELTPMFIKGFEI